MSKKCTCRDRRWLLLFLMPPLGLFILVSLALWKNRLPWTKPPGRHKRLLTYLQKNKAETRDDSLFPELLTPVFKTSSEQLYATIIEACQNLNWKIEDGKVSELCIKAVASSGLLRFKEDVLITIHPVTHDWSKLYISSCSRKGKGDLGTNTRHILDLKRAVHKCLKS